MNSNAGNFADTVINNTSSLITVAATTPAAPIDGVSIAGTVLNGTAGTAKTELDGIVTASANRLTLQVGDNIAIPATLTDASTVGSLANLATQWTNDLNAALTANAIAATISPRPRPA